MNKIFKSKSKNGTSVAMSELSSAKSSVCGNTKAKEESLSLIASFITKLSLLTALLLSPSLVMGSYIIVDDDGKDPNLSKGDTAQNLKKVETGGPSVTPIDADYAFDSGATNGNNRLRIKGIDGIHLKMGKYSDSDVANKGAQRWMTIGLDYSKLDYKKLTENLNNSTNMKGSITSNDLTITNGANRLFGDNVTISIKDGSITEAKMHKDLKDKIESASKLADGNITFGADSGTAKATKFGDKINIKGGNNIATSINGNDISVALSDTLTDIKSLAFTGGVKIDDSGIDAGNKKITNLESGEIADNSKEAVTGEKVKSYIDSKQFLTNANLADKVTESLKTNIKSNDLDVTTTTGSNDVNINLKAGSVTTDKIANKAVTADKIADNAITADKIADNTITKEKMDSTLVTKIENASKLADGNITFGADSGTAKATKFGDKINIKGGNNIATSINGNDISVALSDTLTDIKSLAFTGGVKIDDSGIDAGNKKITNLESGEIADNSKEAVTGEKVKSYIDSKQFLTNANLADKVTESLKTNIKSNDLDVTTTTGSNDVNINLKAGSVKTDKIADGAVTKEKIAAGAITADKIANNTITKEKMDSTLVTKIENASKLADGNITFGADSGTAKATKFGDKINIKGGNNIATSINGNDISVALSDTLTDIKSLAFTGGVKIDDSGIDAGNKKITNLESGEIADNSKEAVTGEKVKSYIDSKQFLTNANLADKVTESLKTNIKSNDLDVTTTTGSNDVNINLKAGSVKTDKIADGAVTKEKIAAGAITADKIADNTITKEKMDSTLVTKIENASKLADGNITFGADSGTAKATKFGDKINIKGGNNIATSINGNDISVALSDTLTDIKSLAFTGGVKIDDSGIDAGNKKITNLESGEIADNSKEAVTGEKVKSYIDSKQFLTNANLADKVTESLKTNIKSNDLDVTTTTGSNDVNINLKAGSVKTDKIADGAVTKEKIAAGAITADKIANNTITKEKMDSTLVTKIENASKLADGNITFGADSGTAKATKFGDKINIKGGNNIATSINGNDISVALSDTLTDIKSLAFTGGVKIDDSGIDAGNKKITNLESGEIADNSKEAVTGEKVKSYIDSKQFLTNANLADKVTESLKTNIKSNDLDVTTTTGSNDVNINLKAGSVTTDKIANKAVTADKIADNAITADKIADNTITKEKMDSTLVTKIENASKLADGNITFGADSGTAKATKFGDKINIKGGNNIATSINGNDISVALSDTLTDIKSLAFTGGVKIDDSGIDAGNKKITNVADGANNTDAVNYKQLQEVKALIGSGGTGGGVSAHDFEELKKQVNKINEEGTKGFHINDMKNADDSKAEGANSIAVGAKASTTTVAADAVAIGSGAKAEASSGVAIGKDSVAKTAAANANDVYLKDKTGVKETVKGNLGALSVGNDTNTRQIVNVAAGTKDTDAANIAQLKAVQNMIQNSSASWVAVNQTGGVAPSATGENSVAVGHNSKASGKNSVAIGAGSDDGGEENVVSVGSSGNERRITNVAEAKNGTDAVNLAQLKKSLQNLQAQNLSGVYEAIDELRDDSRAGVSSALAIGNLMQSTIPGKGLISLGTGYYKGQSATALGISKMSDNGRWVFKGAVSYDSQRNVGAAASIGFHW